MYSDDFLFFSIHILYVLRNFKSKYDVIICYQIRMYWGYVLEFNVMRVCYETNNYVLNMLWGYNICFEDMSWKSMSWEYVLRKHNVFWVYVLNPICFGSMFSNTPCMYWEKRICFGYMCWILYVLEVCFGIQEVCIERLIYMFWEYVSVCMHCHM